MKKLFKHSLNFDFITPLLCIVILCIVILPSCSKKTFYVMFDTDGGSRISGVEVVNGECINEPLTPTKDGYEFKGWYLSKDDIVEYDFTKKVQSSFTLFAKWQKNHTT